MSNARRPDDESLPPRERIVDKTDFERAYRNGLRLHLPGLKIVLRKNRLPYSRIGLSVSRRVGGAVKRNRAKRLMRELFRRNKQIFPRGYDIIFIPNASIFSLGWREHGQNLAKAFDSFKRGRRRSGERPDH